MDSCVFWNAALLTRMSTRPSSANALDHLVAVSLVLDVARQPQAAAAGLLDPVAGLFRVGLFGGQVADGHVRTLTGEGNRDGAADPAVSTRDERDAVFQPAEPLVRFLAVVGRGRHLGIETGRCDRILGVLR